MVDSVYKMNLNIIFSCSCLSFNKVQSCIQFSSYLKQIFEDITTRSEAKITAIDITRFHYYMQLPYGISKQLFKSILQSNESYLTYEEFFDGLKLLYYESIPNQIKFLFDFYSFNNNNLIHPNDIKVLLRQFHMINNSSDMSLLDSILNTALSDNNKPIDFNQWKELLINNSDVFTLTMMFFNHNKPYKEENVIYCAKAAKTPIQSKDIPNRTFDLLSDSTKQLVNYLNKTFNMSLEYNEHAVSDDESELKELNEFEEDKTELLNNLKEISMRLREDKPMLPKRRFETQITSESSTIQQEINFNCNSNSNNSQHKYDRKFKSREVASTQIVQSNFILSKLKLRNGIVTPIDDNSSKGKCVSQTTNMRIECLRLSQLKNKMKKWSINLINDELYLFKYTKESKKEYKSMMSLKEFFINSEDNIKIQSTSYYQVELYSNIEFKPYPIMFYFETKESGLSFIKNLNGLKRYKDNINEYYDIADEVKKEVNGVILKAYNKKNLNTFLIKHISKKNIDTQRQFESINNELSIFTFLTKANHPSVIKGIERYESMNSIYLVYEFPSEGQLMYHLHKNKIISLIRKLKIFTEIALGVQYLHSYGVVYGNCMSSNIFVFKSKQGIQYKLINYELAHMMRNERDQSLDIWNIGQLLFSIIYGYKPYSDRDKKNNKSLEFPDLTIELSEHVILSKIKEIILGCLTSEIKKQITLNKVIELCTALVVEL